jgi:hypothetical protein
MSDDEPADPAPEPIEPNAEPAPIDFDRAEYEEPAAAHVQCGLCKGAITTQYWQTLGKILCADCREIVQKSADGAKKGATLGKAFLYGAGAALGCGIGYAVFVGLTSIQFALITVGIGYVVGRAILKATRGFGSRRHQVMAVVFTYFASSMGYFPAAVQAIREMASHAEQRGASSATAADPAPPSPGATASPAGAPPVLEGTPDRPRPSLGVALLFTAGVTLFLILAAPFLEISNGISGILGLLIIFFGLRTAWRISKGVQPTITGPHQVATRAAA